VALVQAQRADKALLIYEECFTIGQQVEEHLIVGCALEGLLPIDRQRAKNLYQQELARRRTQVEEALPGSRYEMEALAGLLQAYGRQIHYSGELEDIQDAVLALEE